LVSSSLANKPDTASPGTLEAITKATIGLKAVKADDTEVPVYLWDMRIIGEARRKERSRRLRD
jgi:hypothetical protein